MVELRLPQALLIYQVPRFYSEVFCFFLGCILEWVFCCLFVWDMVSCNLGWTGTYYVAKMILYMWSLWHPFQGAGVKSTPPFPTGAVLGPEPRTSEMLDKHLSTEWHLIPSLEVYWCPILSYLLQSDSLYQLAIAVCWVTLSFIFSQESAD